MSFGRNLPLCLLALLLPACGGGGGGGGSGPPPKIPRAFFLADKNFIGTDELFAVYDDGDVLNLSGPVVAGGDVITFSVSFDGRWVDFIADKDQDGVEELYVVPSTGGTALKVSGALVAGGQVDRYRLWAPDSSRLLFLADKEVDETFELYTVEPTGSNLVKVSGSMATGGDVHSLAYNWAGPSRVIYAADQNADGEVEAFSVAAGGGASVELTEHISSTARANAIDVCPDGLKVAVFATFAPASPPQVYSVPVLGGAPTIFSGGLAGGVFKLLFRGWSPDLSKFVYVENGDVYTVNSDGSQRTKVSISNPVVSGSMHWSPDSQYLAYTGGSGAVTAQAGVADSELDICAPVPQGSSIAEWGFSSSGHQFKYLKGGGAKALFITDAGTLGGGSQISATPGWGVNVEHVTWVENDGGFVYKGDEAVDGFQELYYSPTSGSPHLTLSAPALQSGIPIYTVSRDSTAVYFSACRDVLTTFDLYSVPPSGGSVRKLTGPMAVGARVSFIRPAH